MSDVRDLSEFLILSRGKWDENLPPERIQQAIDDFYEWHARLVEQGRAKPGQRLAAQTMVVSKQGITDGPFIESKEVIGGYWFFVAASLADAAALAAQNPCMACGLTYEVRPLELVRCSAFVESNETPIRRKA